jgi:hypothetical protein
MMSDPDFLLRWLRMASARLRLRRTLDLLGWLVSSLSVVLSVYAVARLTLPTVVLAALVPLLLLASFALVAAIAWRCMRRATVFDAAAAADRGAGLNDEIVSASWFAQQSTREPIVSLLIRRAESRVQALDARRLFPLGVPVSLWVSAALVVAASALLALPAATAIQQAPRAALQSAVSDPAISAAAAPPTIEAETPGVTHAAAAEVERAWSQIDALTQALPFEGSAGTLRRAVAARDRQAASEALRAMSASLSTSDTEAQPEGEQLSADVAQAILERLEALLTQDGGAAPPGAKPEAQPTARLTQQLREDISDAQRQSPGQQSQGETALNTLLRAMSRNSWGEREAVRGEGETSQEGGRSNMSGGAMGRRVGVSRAGASDDAPGEGNPEGDAASDPMLGAPTTPLEVQLQKARVDNDAAFDDTGTEEDFYAATQAQAAGMDYAAAPGSSGHAREVALRAGAMPLAFGAAVKRYSLSQHRREATPPEPR